MPELNRPFFFLIAFWGVRYRAYFINRCLPSLLAPNNLPLLNVADGHRLVIATTSEDRKAIERLSIMERLRAHATPIFLEMPSPNSDTPPGESVTIIQQNIYQKRLVEYAYTHRAYGSLLWPDLIFSDGMVRSLLKHANNGCQLVLGAALRQSEEGVIADLEATEHICAGSAASITAQPLVLPARTVAGLSIRHLHPEVRICEEERPGQPLLSIHRYWPVPGHCGIILHSYLYAPFLMDFSAIEHHDTRCLDDDTFENVYVARNFYRCGHTHVVQDSDEFCFVSLTPTSVGQAAPANFVGRNQFWDTTIARQWGIRASIKLNGIYNDRMKLELFRKPVFWHADDIDDNWRRKNDDVTAVIDGAIGDYLAAAARKTAPRAISLNPRHWPVDFYMFCAKPAKGSFGSSLRTYIVILIRALAGNQQDVKRIFRSVRRRLRGAN